MRRRLLGIACAASLVLCGSALICGLIGLWEPNRGFAYTYMFEHHTLTFNSQRGSFAFIWSSGWPHAFWVQNSRQVGKPKPQVVHEFIIARIGVRKFTITPGGGALATITYWGVRTNLWWSLLLTLPAPLAWELARRRGHRRGFEAGRAAGPDGEADQPVAPPA